MIRFRKPVRMTAVTAIAFSGIALPGLALANSDQPGWVQPTMYRVVFSPLNGSKASGVMTMTLEGNNLTIDSHVSGLEPNQMHHQHLHGLADATMAASCPTMANDTNHDGYVSVVEGASSYGKIKASLSSPQTQFGTPPLAALFYPYAGTPQANAFPVADANGNDSYHQTISFDTAKAADAAAYAAITPLTNQVVVLHGETVPGTVDGTDGLGDGGTAAPVYDDLVPVACGVVTQVAPSTTSMPSVSPSPSVSPMPSMSPSPSMTPMPTPSTPAMNMNMPMTTGGDMMAELNFAAAVALVDNDFSSRINAAGYQYASEDGSSLGHDVAKDHFVASFGSARDQAVSRLYEARNALVDTYNHDGLVSTRDQFLNTFQTWLNQDVNELNMIENQVTTK